MSGRMSRQSGMSSKDSSYRNPPQNDPTNEEIYEKMSQFEKIRKNCRAEKKLWEDPDFAAVTSSIFYHQTPPYQFEWKRPSEFVINPAFISSDCDIKPGKLGDRWLAACLGCLRLTEGLLYRVVPADQSFRTEEGYTGVFRFRLWWCGEWQEVVVDDRLPTVKNQLVFISAQQSLQFWPALLEKAYAKLHGSYEALKYGTLLDGMADLTGGITESVTLRNLVQDSIVDLLDSLLRMTSIVTCKAQLENDEPKSMTIEKLGNGIFLNENYRVLATENLKLKTGEQLSLVCLRSTPSIAQQYVREWPDEFEKSLRARFNGHHTHNLNNNNNYYSSSGVIWMSLDSWIRTFTDLDVVHLDMETARDEPTISDKTPWSMRVYHGQWRKGVTAGGCRNYTDTFPMNPQLFLQVSRDTDIVLSITQNNAHEPAVIGFTGYKVEPADVQDLDAPAKDFFVGRRSFINSTYTNARQVTARTRFEEESSVSGTGYLILPTAYEPGQEAGFIFRVLSVHPIKMRLHDSQLKMLKNPIVRIADANIALKSQYQTLFYKVADEQRTVNPFELQDLLEICLPNDYIKSCATLEVCRQIVSVYDRSHQGKLGFKEFKDLICSLKHWQSVFKNHSKETTGVLKAERLRDALLEVGYRLNSSVMSAVMFKYIRKDGTLRFGDFVGAVLCLYNAFEAFTKRESSTPGIAKLTQTEFVKLSISN